MQRIVINVLEYGMFCLSDEAKAHLRSLGYKGDIYFDKAELRSHPLLLQTMEELGEERCSDTCHRGEVQASLLRIVEIPDDVQFTVMLNSPDQRGVEHIKEVGRTWHYSESQKE